MIDLLVDPGDFEPGEERKPEGGADVLVPVFLHVLPDGANVSRRQAALAQLRVTRFRKVDKFNGRSSTPSHLPPAANQGGRTHLYRAARFSAPSILSILHFMLHGHCVYLPLLFDALFCCVELLRW